MEYLRICGDMAKANRKARGGLPLSGHTTLKIKTKNRRRGNN